jgi:hypothetical protein
MQMGHPMKGITLALLALLAAHLVPAGEASACGGPDCEPPVRLFQPERQVPANLIRFKVTAGDPGPLELRAADGSLVPASVRVIGPDRVFAPDAPPAVGQRLTLHYRPLCFNQPVAPGQPPNPTERTFSFFVDQAGEMELVAPVLATTEKGIGYSGTYRRMIVRYEHGLPDRSARASHLTDTTWTIAGRPFDPRLYPGMVRSECTPAQVDWQVNSCGTYFTAPPGKHLLKAISRIVGVDQEFVAELEVDTSCDQVLSIGPYTPPDGGPADLGGYEASVPPEGTRAVVPTTAACAVGGRGASGPWGSLGLLLGTIGWLVRRRR